MCLWTHSNICESKATIQRNAKPELTFWMSSLSNPSNLNLFEGLFFSSFIKTTILPQTNQNLPHGEKPILYGEFLRWIGLWTLMGTIIGPQRQDFWATSPIDKFHGAPLCLGIWMTQTRFETILSAHTLTNITSPTFIDKFWEGQKMVEAWGMNMKDNFIPGYMNCLDESMSVWTNKFTCPGFVFIPINHSPLAMNTTLFVAAPRASCGALIWWKVRIAYKNWEYNNMTISVQLLDCYFVCCRQSTTRVSL